MRLLIADKLHPRAVEELRTLPVDVLYEPELTKETLESKLHGVGILVVRSKEVTRKAIESALHLNLIVRAGAETATIDVKAASERGIYVANCPGKNSSAVAELVYGLLISIDRRIPDAVASLRAGKWERSEFAKAEGLIGKTIGIAGLGAIGRDVAQRAKAFGMHPIGWSRSLSPARAADLGIGYASTLEELASKSDILTLHLALNERTRGIVSRRVFDVMPKRSIFINCARPDLVDYEAMSDAIKSRGLRVGLDVVPNEPRGKKEIPADLFNIAAPTATGGFLYATPHIAASTDQAQLSIATETVRVIRSFLLEGEVPNVVNVMNLSTARFQMVIRMLDKVGTFANVLAVIKRHAINVEEVTNTVFEGGGASCAKLRIVSRPSEGCMAEIRAFEEVLHVDIVTLPNLA
ncbi:MAG TPA: NAD(P)-dependent oxidoreductase [Labilithrix sp.]|jgi:D-3-phosphoglycerate dehydrogenase|nr:NAD(P)-dependent oxidoreductase [Labilithrix sp.]